MKPIDPLQLQRLVDGELDQSQIHLVLTEAKSEPQQWQEIAVGFVENQLWDQAFQSDHPMVPQEHLGSALDIENANTDKQNPDVKTARPFKAIQQDRIQQRSAHSWLVMAASLLVAGMIGYMANHIQNRNIPPSEIAEESLGTLPDPLIVKNLPDSHEAEPKLTPASMHPDFHLEVPQDNEHLRDMVAAGPVAPVPLYRIGNAEQLKQFNRQRNPPEIPIEILQRLNGSGYQMQQEFRFISGRLGDGRSFVVPVRTVRFLPGQ